MINGEIYAACGDGWKDIILSTHEKLLFLDPNYEISQIKEKFGGLRYYFTTTAEYPSPLFEIMQDIVRLAEYKSSYTCELCGAAGYDMLVETRVSDYFYYTYCKKCSDNFLSNRKLFKKGDSNE